MGGLIGQQHVIIAGKYMHMVMGRELREADQVDIVYMGDSIKGTLHNVNNAHHGLNCGKRDITKTRYVARGIYDDVASNSALVAMDEPKIIVRINQ